MLKRIGGYLYHHPTSSGGLAVLWTSLILYACTIPGKELPKVNLFDQFDKVVHFLLFLGFYTLWFCWWKRKWFWLLLSILLGFAIEWYQLHYVPGRSFDVWDGVADSLGALAALLLLPYFLPRNSA